MMSVESRTNKMALVQSRQHKVYNKVGTLVPTKMAASHPGCFASTGKLPKSEQTHLARRHT